MPVDGLSRNASTGNYVMKEMPSGCAASTCVITLFADVVGVAVSASGILYFSDVNADNNTVDEFFPQSLRLHAVAVRSTGPAVYDLLFPSSCQQ